MAMVRGHLRDGRQVRPRCERPGSPDVRSRRSARMGYLPLPTRGVVDVGTRAVSLGRMELVRQRLLGADLLDDSVLWGLGDQPPRHTDVGDHGCDQDGVGHDLILAREGCWTLMCFLCR